MGLDAAAAYLRTLREARGLTQTDVAAATATSIKQVWRWEHGKSEPSASALAAFTDLVNGSAVDVQRLLLDSDANQDTGKQAAHAWLSAGSVAVDHIVPRTKRDDADMANGLVMCATCHAALGDRFERMAAEVTTLRHELHAFREEITVDPAAVPSNQMGVHAVKRRRRIQFRRQRAG